MNLNFAFWITCTALCAFVFGVAHGSRLPEPSPEEMAVREERESVELEEDLQKLIDGLEGGATGVIASLRLNTIVSERECFTALKLSEESDHFSVLILGAYLDGVRDAGGHLLTELAVNDLRQKCLNAPELTLQEIVRQR